MVIRRQVRVTFGHFNLEIAVGRARWCVWACVCREARRRQAGACNDERQRQARDRACQRVRSEFTRKVGVIESRKTNVHIAFHRVMSGQLQFLLIRPDEV
jgi:hypothetical protein